MVIGGLASALPADRRPLMSMPEIAALAGVHRPVVTNWRRRHSDFPVPVTDDAARPLFDARQVARWLVDTGRAARDQIEPELAMYVLSAVSMRLPASQFLEVVTALICLRHLDDDPLAGGELAGGELAKEARADEAPTGGVPRRGPASESVLAARAARADPHDEQLLSEITGQLADAAALSSMVDDLVEAAWGCAGAFEHVVRFARGPGAGGLGAEAVAPELARLIAEVSGARDLARMGRSLLVADPAAGAGDLLTAVSTLLGPDHAPTFSGAERQPRLARLTRRRLTVQGIPPADIDVMVGAGLPEDAGDPDVIVTQVPYIPGEDRSAEEVLARIADVAIRVAPGRSAVILGPADVLVAALPPFSPAERTRAQLLTRGLVEAIIRLPGGMLPFRPGYEAALWVLTSAYRSRWAGRVLLADVCDRELTSGVADALAEDVTTWRRDGYNPDAHARAFGVQVRISDLVNPPRPLTVRRPPSLREITTSGPNDVSRVIRIAAELDRLAAHATAVRKGVNAGIVAGPMRRPTTDTVASLRRTGRLQLLPGARLAEGDIGTTGQHPVLGPAEVLGLRKRGSAMIDRGVLAQRYPQVRLTEPGDVIVTTSPEFGAVVDTDGYSVACFPARILRIPPAERERFTPRVLAALLAAAQSGTRPGGAVRPPRRLAERLVPLLPPTDMLRLDTLLADLDGRRQQAQAEVDMLTEIRQIATAGLSDGTLALTDQPTPDPEDL